MFTISSVLVLAFTIYLEVSRAAGIVGPVLAKIFPDPSIIKVHDTYYAFSSRDYQDGKLINTPIASSKHFQSGWNLIDGDVLPHPGKWAVSGNAEVYTPDINQLVGDPICSLSRLNEALTISQADGSFILYYIAVPKDYPQKQHCVAAATSPKVTGPYTPQAKPLLCPKSKDKGIGIADPNGFTYDGDRYLVFKNASGHDAQQTCYIAIEKVEANGYTPAAGTKWTDLINSTHADENDVEGSVLVKNPSNNGFVLFFTAGTYNTTNLRIEYATAEKLLGPYERKGVLLKTGSYGGVKIVAPVGLDVVNGNVSEAVFESYREENDRDRLMYTVVLKYKGDVVTIG